MSYRDISEAFREIIMERARFKSELPPLPRLAMGSPDPFRFVQGAPLLTSESLIPLADSWESAMDRLFPAIQEGFPQIRNELDGLRTALKGKRLDPRRCAEVLLNGKDNELGKMACDLGMASRTLRFILTQFIKPCIEKRSQCFKPLIENLTWSKGYCPICGSLAEMGFLKGDGSHKWLMCALCGHQWHYMSGLCPFCENTDPEQMEYLFVEDREYELAELCHECKRYLLCIDEQSRPKDTSWVGSKGLVYLDVLAQQRGFLPVALSAWNVLLDHDRSGFTVTPTGTPWTM